MIQTLPPSRVSALDAPVGGGPDSPMRQVTRAVADDASAWTPQMAREVVETFDGLAAERHTRLRPDRGDGLARGWAAPGRAATGCAPTAPASPCARVRWTPWSW